jgi:hypothetical protein
LSPWTRSIRTLVAPLLLALAAGSASAFDGARDDDPARCVRPAGVTAARPVAPSVTTPRAVTSRHPRAVPTPSDAGDRLQAKLPRVVRGTDPKPRADGARHVPAVPGLGALLRLGQSTLRDISWLFEHGDSSAPSVIAGRAPPACAQPLDLPPAADAEAGPVTPPCGSGSSPEGPGSPVTLSAPVDDIPVMAEPASPPQYSMGLARGRWTPRPAAAQQAPRTRAQQPLPAAGLSGTAPGRLPLPPPAHA